MNTNMFTLQVLDRIIRLLITYQQERPPVQKVQPVCPRLLSISASHSLVGNYDS